MLCGCQPVAEVRAEDRWEVTSVSPSGVKGARPDGGQVVDALFFSRITFSFFEATAVHCASDAVIVGAYVGAVLAVKREGGGGYCVQIANPPPRATHHWENRPTRPIDRQAP